MSLRTRRDIGTRGANCNARADIRDDFELPQHIKANPAFLPSPPLSRTTTAASQGGSMDSLLKLDGDAADPHTCPHCTRQFRRFCDLNKHAKSHIRPFKCSDPTCKYSTLGWPTRKELERHNNDKHAPAPQTYSCLFQPCPYESKRESNCKQHMEKTHGYIYVRCKYNGARIPGHVKTESYPEADDVTRVVPIVSGLNQPKSPKLRGIGSDFLLFPDDADHSIIIGHDSNDDPDRRDSQVFIPWTSPSTRFKANMTLLRRFSQAYEPSERSAEDEHLADFHMSQVDPNLESVTANMADKPVPPAVEYAEALALDDDEPMEMHSSNTSNIRERAGGAAPPSQSQVTASSSANPSGLSNVASQKTALYPMSLKQDDSDDNDEDRPRKRLKRAEKMDFRDTEMPDIFHAAHPQIYNRDQKALFGSCHSTHKDISTLVRHLGRAPHKLDVRERFVSSFDVQDEEQHSHPKVGLCRRCWVRFHDRESFNRHVSTECEKASKGKREKWQILFDTFTPISAPDMQRLSSGYANPLNLNLGPHLVLNQRHETQPTETPGPETMPIPPPPPASVDMGWSVASQHMDDGAFVPIAEYRRLDATVQSLHADFQSVHADLQSMKRLMQAFIIHHTGRPSGLASSHHVAPSVNPFDSHPGGWVNRGPQEAAVGMRDEAADEDVGSLPDRLDRGSLVGYMDSQPTDVDPQGLIEEVEETLSRANSGLGSERSALRHSALRHVPNSPPTRAHEDADAASARSGGPSAHGRPQDPRHQPTSIPDSGYGSDKKRSSLGELDLNEQLRKPATHPEGPQQTLLHPHDAVMSGDHKQPLQQDHLGVAQHRGASHDPTMVSPYLSETGVSMPGWGPQGAVAFAPSDPTDVNDFVQGPFSPYGSGNEEFPFHDYVYHSED